MEYQYNLIDEKWIPCKLLNGEFGYFSLRQVFSSASEIKEIISELPPMTASIFFLLLSILYRTQRIEVEEDWDELWQAGQFKLKEINSYFDQWHHRFDIFDIEHPFYQDPLIGLRPKDVKNLSGKEIQIKMVNNLILHSSSGDAATLFDHTLEDNGQKFTQDEISRLLLMFQAFSLGGMTSASVSIDKYYNDSPHARGAVFFIKENNLFRSLMLNLISKDEWPIKANKDDKPAWEKDDPLGVDRTIPDGMLDFLTWQSRRIKLIPELNNEQTMVQKLYINPGLTCAAELINPFYSTQIIESSAGKLEKKILRFSETKALWRDSTVLLEGKTKQRRPPEAISWINFLKAEKIIENEIKLSAYGISTDPGKKKAFFYREEHFDFPIIFLQDDSMLNTLNRCLDIAKDVQAQLWGALRQLSGLILSFNSDKKEGRKAAASDEQNLIAHWGAEEVFWKELELGFTTLIHFLPLDKEKAIETWIDYLRKSAFKAFGYATSLSGNSIPVLKASAKAKQQLISGLNKVLNFERKEEK